MTSFPFIIQSRSYFSTLFRISRESLRQTLAASSRFAVSMFQDAARTATRTDNGTHVPEWKAYSGLYPRASLTMTHLFHLSGSYSIRYLPTSPPPPCIRQLDISVSQLTKDEFERLIEAFRHRCTIQEWILTAEQDPGFLWTRLVSSMKLFRPERVTIQSSHLLRSKDMKHLLESNKQLWSLELEVEQDYDLSELPLDNITSLKMHILQDQHIHSLASIANSNISITHLTLHLSHGLTAMQHLSLPKSVETLTLFTQQVSRMQFEQISNSLRQSENVESLYIKWRGSNPDDLLGLQPVPHIESLEILTTYVLNQDILVSALGQLFSDWSHVGELKFGARRQLDPKCYQELVESLGQAPFSTLHTLCLAVGEVLKEEEFCNALIDTVSKITTLTALRFDSCTRQMEPHHLASLQFWTGLHRLPQNVLALNLGANLWPRVLAKTNFLPSVVYHVVRSKNDLIIPRQGQRKMSGAKRKRKDKTLDSDNEML
jgi:hypothetical protein